MFSSMLQESCSNMEVRNITSAVEKAPVIMLLSPVGLRKRGNSTRVANQNGKRTGITGGAMEEAMGCYSARGAGILRQRGDV